SSRRLSRGDACPGAGVGHKGSPTPPRTSTAHQPARDKDLGVLPFRIMSSLLFKPFDGRAPLAPAGSGDRAKDKKASVSTSASAYASADAGMVSTTQASQHPSPIS